MKKIEVLFENSHFIALDKPSGYLSVPSRQGAADPRPCLATVLSKQFPEILPVHRLDEEVSGLILFAKTKNAHRAANSWFENHSVQKIYEAWTEHPNDSGSFRQSDQHFIWESQILRGKRRAYESPHGKKAITMAYWKGEAEFQGESIYLWQLEPKTGRGHQLRFELAKHGYPILGDQLYGAKREFYPNSIALRAVELRFAECKNEAKNFELPEFIRARKISEVFGSASQP